MSSLRMMTVRPAQCLSTGTMHASPRFSDVQLLEFMLSAISVSVSSWSHAAIAAATGAAAINCSVELACKGMNAL